MTPRIITADASKISGADFARSLGLNIHTREQRAAEAAYLEFENAHWRAAKAESNAIVRREGEAMIDFIIRKLKPLYDHDDWRAEQSRLWANGQWEPPADSFRKHNRRHAA